MALDRQSIEKKDFPIERRGYDPEAVDAHLSTIADAVEELRRGARQRSDTLASAASEQVRAIVEAAETSAAQIQRQAEEAARQIREEARAEAASTREQATGQAQEYVGQVSHSTSAMLERLEAMETELRGLIESLRSGGNRLNDDLRQLESSLGEVRGAGALRTRFESEPAGSGAAGVEAESEAGGWEDASDPEPAPESGIEAVDGGDTGRVAEPGAGLEGDVEGARLVALNMALNGTPRADTDRYLAENFHLGDRARLLDEVYESLKG